MFLSPGSRSRVRPAIQTAAQGIVPSGRLSLTSGTPITGTDVTAATVVYFMPYNGNAIELFNGAFWVLAPFSQLAFSISGLAANTNFDLWGRLVGSSTMALDATAWTNDTTRAVGLVTLNGIDVKSTDFTRRLLGTFRTTGTIGQTEDSRVKRYLSNRYNDVARVMVVTDPTATWTYNVATYRQANGNTANQLEFVCCVARPVSAVAISVASSGGVQTSVTTGIGLDQIPPTTPDSIMQASTVIAATGGGLGMSAYYAGTPGVGRHFLAWLEYGSAATTVTWQGTNLPFSKTGITGIISN